MKSVNYYRKKLKAYQRAPLMPLYRKHSLYLLRAIKTMEQKYSFDWEKFLSNIETYQQKATCHEVAINACSTGPALETHQNPRGLEAHYTAHPKAEKVGRNHRVRLVWALIWEAINKNPALKGYKLYKDLDDSINIPLMCPYCGTVIARVIERDVVVGYHEDGTENFTRKVEIEWEGDCEHLVISEGYNYCEGQGIFHHQDIVSRIHEIEMDINDLLGRMDKLFIDYKVVDDSAFSREDNITRIIFCKNPARAVKILNGFINAQICIYDIFWEIFEDDYEPFWGNISRQGIWLE